MVDSSRIDTSLARAATLPSSAYLEPAVFEREKERIFRANVAARRPDRRFERDPATSCQSRSSTSPSWLHGFDERVARLLQRLPPSSGPGALTRGNRKSLQCRYHGWPYGLDGALRAAPRWMPPRLRQGRLRSRAPGSGVEPVRVRHPRPSAPSLARMEGQFGRGRAASASTWDPMTLVERRDYEIECNSKVYVDNYLEGYPADRSPELFREIDFTPTGSRRSATTRGNTRRSRAQARPGAWPRPSLRPLSPTARTMRGTTGFSRTRCSTLSRQPELEPHPAAGRRNGRSPSSSGFSPSPARVADGNRCSRRSASRTNPAGGHRACEQVQRGLRPGPTNRPLQRKARERGLPLPVAASGVPRRARRRWRLIGFRVVGKPRALARRQ